MSIIELTYLSTCNALPRRLRRTENRTRVTPRPSGGHPGARIAGARCLLPGQAGELAEVPADQLVRGQPAPRVAAVGRVLAAAHVLACEKLLRGGESRIWCGGARDVTDR